MRINRITQKVFMRSDSNESLVEHLEQLKACQLCPNMVGPVVTPRPVLSKVYLVGQAPGPREGELGRPFAWTAGRRMFSWFQSIGVSEEQFRSRVYLSAVCRCFPGKAKSGGDRVPSLQEIETCSAWMEREIKLLAPDLVIPVGKLAIERFLPGTGSLAQVIGKQFQRQCFDVKFDLIALPHPSGASTWFVREPGKTLLQAALKLLSEHSAFRAIV